MKRMIVFLLAAAVAAPALAQAARPAPAARPAQAPQAGQPQQPATPEQRAAALRQLGFSAAGIAALEQSAATDRAAVQAVQPQIAAGRTALVAAAQATPFNEKAFEQLMRDQQARVDRLTAQLAGDRVTLLRSLPAADQQIFAKLIILGPPRPPGAPAAPPPRR